MPAGIVRGDKVRISAERLAKYRAAAHEPINEDTVFAVTATDKVCGRKRLYVDKSPSALWANDCKLIWGRDSKERKTALGVL